MKLKKLSLLLLLCVSVGFTSCKSHEAKDTQIKTDIEKILVPGVTVEVDRGVAKINGTFENEQTHTKVLEEARKVKNVKSVLDNAITQAAPTVTPDNMLQNKIDAILVSYPLVTASINDGLVTLNGTIERAELPKLMQKVNETQPKKVENLLKINN
ncbi:BON domain-containing protein [Flavobacterium ardleyense]|uniref:BON domain-containing protein n=1 Tax=Flavobacterium ardleyense TaxID=2038737 RepID=UPI00298C5C7B|nr:BON domain-containing protein [Flavobacterium ardleyense]